MWPARPQRQAIAVVAATVVSTSVSVPFLMPVPAALFFSDEGEPNTRSSFSDGFGFPSRHTISGGSACPPGPVHISLQLS